MSKPTITFSKLVDRLHQHYGPSGTPGRLSLVGVCLPPYARVLKEGMAFPECAPYSRNSEN